MRATAQGTLTPRPPVPPGRARGSAGLWLVIALLVMGLGVAAGARTVEAQTAGLTEELLRNATYPSE